MPVTPVSGGGDGLVVVDFKEASCFDAEARSSCCADLEPRRVPLLVEQLLGDLRAAFQAEKEAGFTIDNNQDPASFKRLNDRVQELLHTYSTSNQGDWRRFALFNDVHYVRNLVEANNDFELIVLCWKGGQVSRVHNHASSHCWLAVLDGEMREVQYRREGRPPGSDAGDQPGSSVHVEAVRSTDMKIGDVGYINDHLALHSVGCYMTTEQLEQWNQQQQRNGEEGGWRLEGGVTLHLYSPPIRRVRIYEDDTVSERTPGFYSKAGVRV